MLDALEHLAKTLGLRTEVHVTNQGVFTGATAVGSLDGFPVRLVFQGDRFALTLATRLDLDLKVT